MAETVVPNRVQLSPTKLTALKNLTLAITEAVLHGDLDLAAQLLEQRRTALHDLDWSRPLDEETQTELQNLWALEERLLDFCQSWRHVLKERLQTINTSHFLRRKYTLTNSKTNFVDLRK
ncbi:MAG: hypothetical protein AB1491_05800 [Thermodesulfobacteriota bacterium]